MTVPFIPRAAQREILKYPGGRLGISAVPGSGKTHTLSALAAQIISRGQLERGQEVLIVTLVNSAVDNFEARIADFEQASRLLPRLGYRVRTLHGLAHDIVREDPPLVGLDKQFTILDETASSSMIHDAAQAWTRLHPEVPAAYLSVALDDYQRRRIAGKDWPRLIESLAASFVRAAKDRRLTPEVLRRDSERLSTRLPLLEAGLEIYADYQRGLTYRGAVDFDDLIQLAARMLELSSDLLQRLRQRWPYVLEDEAQDSSRLQQDIISMLVGEHGNWVRVGDPNQAIFETFTTADPELLRRFIQDNPSVDMPESGRCQPSVVRLANFLIEWTMTQHPLPDIRDALSRPLIQAAPPDDPQPNPADDPGGIALLPGDLTPEQEIREVVKSLLDWLPAHQDQTVAVLSATNDHASNVVRALQQRNIACRELLRSTSPTRAAAGALSHVLTYLAAPESTSKLVQTYRVWRRAWRGNPQHEGLYNRVAGLLATARHVEDFLAPAVESPTAGISAAAEAALEALSDPEKVEIQNETAAFRRLVRRWHGATLLPVDQLVLSIAQEIFTEPADLAVAHKLALVLRQLADENPHWRLPDLTPHLKDIARNERRFIGFSSDDAGFNPDAYKGIVVVATIHKAKGLEWDRVYLLSINSYDFPSAQTDDQFISEKWFLRDGLNLEAEALAQLKTAASTAGPDRYEELKATQRSRLDYARERLRLLYVGITRARRELILSWNTGRRGDARPALPLAALERWWEQADHQETGPADQA